MIGSGSEELTGIQVHDRVPAELDSSQLVRGSRAGRQTVRPDSRLAGAAHHGQQQPNGYTNRKNSYTSNIKERSLESL